MRKERNKWDGGGGGWRRKRDCLRRVGGTKRRTKLKSEQGGSFVGRKGGYPKKKF